MQKQSIRQLIVRDYGEMVSVADVKKIIGAKSYATAAKFVAGLDSYDIGTKRMFFAGDVAERISASKRA